MSETLVPSIQKSTAGMSSGVSAIENSMVDCEKIRAKAQQIRDQLHGGDWTGGAGATFVRSMDGWLESYWKVLQELGKIRDLVQASDTQMTTTDDDATVLAVSAFGDVSDNIFKRVTGA
ncbi:WXG100 family type VII secretion target [Nocardia sp. NRRL S-836]|uniref:WXG100 family type VII secretion target n=1 Tax=Nocardia sp. NRRL S-836 TaxID=1519492 RepID=UPI0006AE489F|nr:WXG100 family type VII secretion target [Nocardia sp. NRRL S-836]KOV81000.1 hypothetical protein ADL03_30485 [Nocardia sp. NRRL S-836]